MSLSQYDRVIWGPGKRATLGPTLAERVQAGTLNYGDPPTTADCCNAGSTMTVVPQWVIEFWKNEGVREGGWVRVPELEGDVKNPNEVEYDEDDPET